MILAHSRRRTKIRAVMVDRPGGLEALQVREVQDPEPGPGEVLIDVAFAGCNWADTQVRNGRYPHPIDYPRIVGSELSGRIAALGPGAHHFRIGERVAAIAPNGAYAERCVSPETLVTRLPDEVPLDVGAAFQTQAFTAYHLLHTVYRIEAGDAVLVHAAGGGVGLCVIQLAVAAGARTIGTVGTPGKEQKALAYGAEQVVLRSTTDFVAAAKELTGGRGVDLAIDSLGGETLDRTFDAVRTLGHVINIGEAEGIPYRNIRERLLPRSLTFTRFHLGNVRSLPVLWKEGAEFVLRGLLGGWLRVPIVERFPLDEVRAMHERLEGRGVSGKLLLAIAAR
jgi:NADPH2:quinone reductase